jgi:hypothetical protein
LHFTFLHSPLLFTHPLHLRDSRISSLLFFTLHSHLLLCCILIKAFPLSNQCSQSDQGHI